MRISDWSSDVCSSDLDVRTDLAALQRPDARAGDDNRVAFGRGDVGLRKVEVEYRALSDRERELVGPPDAARRRQFETIGTDRERRDIVAAVRAHRDTARQAGVRSEARRVGKECVRTGGYRWSRYH